MAYKDDPGMHMVNLWMPRTDADALVRFANSRGLDDLTPAAGHRP